MGTLSNIAGTTVTGTWVLPASSATGTNGYLSSNALTAAGSTVGKEARDTSDAGQNWFRSSSDILGYFTLRNTNSGKYLNANGPTTLILADHTGTEIPGIAIGTGLGGILGNLGSGVINNCLFKRSITKRSPQDVGLSGGGGEVVKDERFFLNCRPNCNNCYCSDNNCRQACQKCQNQQFGGGLGNCLYKRSVSKRSPQELSSGQGGSNANANERFNLANCLNNGGGFGNNPNGGGFGNNQNNQFSCLTCSCALNICASQCTKCSNNGGGFGNNQGFNCNTCSCGLISCAQQCTKCSNG